MCLPDAHSILVTWQDVTQACDTVGNILHPSMSLKGSAGVQSTKGALSNVAYAGKAVALSSDRHSLAGLRGASAPCICRTLGHKGCGNSVTSQ